MLSRLLGGDKADSGGPLESTACALAGVAVRSRRITFSCFALLYPASTACAHTAFTFCVLDDFLVSNKVSGCPAQSYYEHIRRVTDSAFPDKVPGSGTNL